MRDLYRMLLPILLVLNVSAYDCIVRADCNNHGDCENGMCQCDKGWSGTQCNTSLCQLQCQHGSKPDTQAAECTKCVDCWPGWQGQLCDTWSDNAANISDMTTQLTSFSDASLSEYKALFNQPEPPIPGQFGLGIDAVTGKYKKLPVFRLDFSNPNLTYVNSKGKVYRLPKGVKFNAIPGGIYTSSDKKIGFYNIAQYRQYIAEMQQNSTGEPALDPEVSKVYSSRFNLGCKAYSVSHRSWELYNLEITDVSALKLNKYVAMALDYLPPTYDTDTQRTLWDTFLDQYGTGVNQKVWVGGMAVVEAVIKASIFDFEQFNWYRELGYDLDCQLKGACTQLNAFYNVTRSVQPTTFYGGDPSETQNLENWRQTIEINPAKLRYEYAAFSSLIEDTKKRTIHQSIVQNHVNNVRKQMQSDLTTKAKPHWCKIDNVVSKSFQGDYFLKCPAGDHVLSCALDLKTRSGAYDSYPVHRPLRYDGHDGCECWDNVNTICYAVCGQLANPDLTTNTPALHDMVVKTGGGNAVCPSGWVTTGCGFGGEIRYAGGNKDLLNYPSMIPHSNYCECHDGFNQDCYAVCMPSFASPGNRVIRDYPGGTLSCVSSERAIGCGFYSDPSKQWEPFRGFHPTQNKCDCYDFFGGFCYAICSPIT